MRVSPELAQAIAAVIAESAGTVLVQRGVPGAAVLSGELGNNCAQTVALLLEEIESDVTDLALCEQGHVVLRPGCLYRFEKRPDCVECQELTQAARWTST